MIKFKDFLHIVEEVLMKKSQEKEYDFYIIQYMKHVYYLIDLVQEKYDLKGLLSELRELYNSNKIIDDSFKILNGKETNDKHVLEKLVDELKMKNRNNEKRQINVIDDIDFFQHQEKGCIICNFEEINQIFGGVLSKKLYLSEKNEPKVNKYRDFKSLSAGEECIFTRFGVLYNQVITGYGKSENKEKYRAILLIDEPDLHLHLDWQKKYIQKLIDVFSTLPENINVHFIIATHSPFIISDLPAECIVRLEGKGKNEDGTQNKNGTGKYTRITTYDDVEHSSFDDFDEFKEHTVIKKSFGANYVDIINDGFFFDDKVLMGGFAERIIGDVAEEDRTFALLSVYDFKKDKELINKLLNHIGKADVNSKQEFLECIEDYKKEKIKKLDIKNNEISVETQIGDEYLKDNLLYFVKGNKDD